MNTDSTRAVYHAAARKAKHNNPAYSKLSLFMGCGIQIKGEGSFVEDHAGRRLLALFDQYGNQSFGYSHPVILNALRDKLESKNLNSTKILFEEDQILLAEQLARLTGNRLKYSYFANGGGESIDNALKLARAHTGRMKFVSACGCFHGKTFAALSASNRPEHVALFKPMLSKFATIPYNNISALRDAIDDKTAAVILEPVQAESGVYVPTKEYLHEARRLCTKHGALLIFDEMQTAFGRTGSFFAFQHFDVMPDLMCIGKAFGGGLVPISAVMAKEDVWQILWRSPSTFGSSLGGNPLCCRAGLAVLEVSTDESFLVGVRRNAAIMAAQIRSIAHRHFKIVKEHRGIGMMHGLELINDAAVGLALRLLYEKGATSTFCLYNNRVLRVQPPLTIDERELMSGLSWLDEVLQEVEQYFKELPRGRVRTGNMEIEKTVEIPLERFIAVLHANPNLLDPFALHNYGPQNLVDEEFEGTVGGDPLTWPNSIFLSRDGLTSSARAGWIWTKLERRISATTERSTTMRIDKRNKDSTKVSIRIDWDAGTGAYESFLSARISHYVSSRMDSLLSEVSKIAIQSETSVVSG